ncbi:hypothetical protein LJR231_002240 [Phyllobacterium sp. LjRoot231]|uniref:hypothetical protein n=1 Tax=Phyllobacterium sp. LjRoot231 TaxID=3342289 RepID=UPI003ECDD423
MTKAKHPMQPIVWVGDVIRFKENKIVRHLVDNGSIDLNAIAVMDFPREDHEQLAQLIGYSVSGFGDLSYASRKAVKEADTIAAEMSEKRKSKHR